jgi:DNA-binding response OmpR family regulator
METAPRPGLDPGPPPPSGARALLVEDERVVGDLLADFLALEGYEVDRAMDGRQALELVRRRSYALIVSDVRMPDLSGPALYRELLRVNPALARRVVFVTGDIVSPETRRFLDETGLGYLAKPFAVSEFQSAIRRVLASDQS